MSKCVKCHGYNNMFIRYKAQEIAIKNCVATFNSGKI